MAHLPGGEQLEEAFHSLRLWIMGVAYFDGWQGTPQRQAGNNLLQLVRVQHNYVRHKVPRRELKTELAKQGEGMSGPVNAVDKAAAVVMQRMSGKVQRSTPSWKRQGQGKGSAGAK
ncbi:hypothetical protein DIPPA_05842 [Diplonema papillatum]|nr:hypothetical protein DIPPA_24922 [Diplonema papillatum]KAJ9447990.1 hypothetical protein DIPPA_02663 [Diplonema papillatum]KAJ9457109.1 hypothetical protein DIPPA_05842 [Diplonema papillatum]